MSRPESKNVFYFPHYTKKTVELELIEHKHGSEGYKTYYRLMEMVADAPYHKLSVKSDDEEIMFELGMKCNNDVVTDVIRILIERDKIDKDLWEKHRIIWMEDFVETLKPVYVNRRKNLPTKDDISTCKNTQKRKEKKNKGKKEKKKKNHSDLLSVSEYQELYPNKDVQGSINKFLEYYEKPSHSKAIDWLDREKKLALDTFKKTKSGLTIAYCSKCGNKHFPNSDYLLKNGSTCCRVEYVPFYGK